MKDINGSLIEEGLYVVYVQMNAEREPVSIETDASVDGKAVVSLETCWDDPAYDNVGHHRVVESFEFKASNISRTITQEKKYSGDFFN